MEGIGESRKILIVEDDAALAELLAFQLRREGYDTAVVGTGEQALALVAASPPDLVLLDIMLPGTDGVAVLSEIAASHPDLPVVMMTAAGTIDLAVSCMKKGAYDFLAKPFEFERLRAIVQNALRLRDMTVRVRRLERQVADMHAFDHIVAFSPGMKEAVEAARRAASSGANVLLLGESGGGKEVLARAIHFNGPRRSGPFVAVNCGAIPEGLLESELFGHEKGAFTGAFQRRAGCFEQAHGGTLFLDEIAEMRPDMQVRLLRAIERREIRRVGGDRTITVDVRIISATNQNLAARMREQKFREDLYYRLAVLIVRIPPLRDRVEDIEPLAERFLREMRERTDIPARRLSPEAAAALKRYRWPGNARELRNAIERAAVFEESDTIRVENLPQEIRELASATGAFEAVAAAAGAGQTAPAVAYAQHSAPPADWRATPSAPAIPPGNTQPRSADGYSKPPAAAPRETPGSPPAEDGRILTMEEEERRIITRALALTGGNISDAARRLGLHRSTLHRKLVRYGLATPDQIDKADGRENAEVEGSDGPGNGQ
ncbi:MAG: sigma-54 dependent transcriptional regulator [Planctomycetota bacterium]|nr:sigma-54 dependent transcriptional regulator [Planctomycetota bacterium]